MAFHETALISDNAKIGNNVQIGPYSVIGAAQIADNVTIHSHVVLGDGVSLAEGVEVFPGAVIGRVPKGARATSRAIDFEPTISVGAGSSIGAHAILYYDVRIGSGTLVGDGASIREQCHIGAQCIISRYVTINYNTRIGDRVKVMDLTHLTGNMIVEDDAFISCLVATTNDNQIRDGFGDHVVGPVVKCGATIGSAASLLPGVIIGEGSFAASGAVVTKAIPDGETWLGNPARPRSR